MSNLKCNETFRDTPSPQPTIRYNNSKNSKNVVVGAEKQKQHFSPICNTFVGHTQQQKTTVGAAASNKGGPGLNSKKTPSGGALNNSAPIGQHNPLFVRKVTAAVADHQLQRTNKKGTAAERQQSPLVSGMSLTPSNTSVTPKYVKGSKTADNPAAFSAPSSISASTGPPHLHSESFGKAFHHPSTIVAPFLSSNIAFLAPVTKLLPNNIYSAMFPYNAAAAAVLDQQHQQHYQSFLKHASSSVKQVAASEQTNLLNSNVIRDSVSISPSTPKTSNVAKVTNLPTVVTRSPVAQQHQQILQTKSSTILAVNDTQANSKPLTLHINTGKGTAVLQVQQSTGSPPKPMPPSKRTDQQQSMHFGTGSGGGATVVSSTNQIHSSAMAAPTVNQSPSRIFPTAITLPNPVLPPPYVYQDHASGGGIFHQSPSTSAVTSSLTEQQRQHHVTNKLRPSSPVNFGQSPLFSNTRTILPASHQESPIYSGHAAVGRLSTNFLKPNSSPASSSLNFSPSSSFHAQNQNGGATGPSLSQGAAGSTVTTPGQSPRPSILRKRPGEAFSSAASSSVSKRLTYNSSNNNESNNSNVVSQSPLSAIVARRILDVPSVAADEVVISATGSGGGFRSLEHPDAGNSNHSSSASTASGGSSVNEVGAGALFSHPLMDGGGTPMGANCPSTSPSPRKRQRKQKLDDLPDPFRSLSGVTAPAPLVSSASGTPVSSGSGSGSSVIGQTAQSEDESNGRCALDTPRFRLRHTNDYSPHFYGTTASLMASPASSVSPMVQGTITTSRGSANSSRPFSSGNSSRSLKQFKQSPYCLNDNKTDSVQDTRNSDSSKAKFEEDLKNAKHRRSLLLWPGPGNESSWKPRRNHFLHYEDVKFKDERKPTVTELCNQKQIWQRVEGFRIDLLDSHFYELDACEAANVEDVETVYSMLESPLCKLGLEPGEIDSMQEMALTNRQRCRAVRELLDDVRKPLLSIMEHRQHVEQLVQKYSTKRTARKKMKGHF